MYKKILPTLLALLIAMSSLCLAEKAYDISNTVQKVGAEYKYRLVPVDEEETKKWLPGFKTLYGRYPVVGRDVAAIYYLDPSSCAYTLNGDMAIISCLVYDKFTGQNPDGSEVKAGMSTYRFATQKTAENLRKIYLLSVIDNVTGENVTKRAVALDNGFLKALFWSAAHRTDINQYLD
ncbi:MAG: hypothetical protein IJ849_00535 [Selenomonadaceae bacterium]|nr:hypothetical protein [Selenomonadaceae bacterium]